MIQSGDTERVGQVLRGLDAEADPSVIALREHELEPEEVNRIINGVLRLAAVDHRQQYLPSQALTIAPTTSKHEAQQTYDDRFWVRFIFSHL